MPYLLLACFSKKEIPRITKSGELSGYESRCTLGKEVKSCLKHSTQRHRVPRSGGGCDPGPAPRLPPMANTQVGATCKAASAHKSG